MHIHNNRKYPLINQRLKLLPLLLIFLFNCFSPAAQERRALIVAIGNYPKSGGWETINSLNDVPLVKNALLNQRFPEGNIRVITDSLATRAGIESALDQLIKNAGTGDIVVIYFSSHGEQIEDNNNDETDGLDECIVPYDAVLSYDKSLYSKYAKSYFRDDAFGEKVTMLRNKLGKSGDLLVGIDACHSGTGTRSVTAKVRGNKTPMVSERFVQSQHSFKDTSGVFDDNNAVRLHADASSYVVLSGARAKELNYECYDEQDNPVGSLTYAFNKSLNSLDGEVTYRSLFARMNELMREIAPNQNPVIEGDGIDRELFGGKYVQQAPYITVNDTLSDKEYIVINAGTVSGITTGSMISFFPAGTTDPSNASPLLKGTVVSATNFSATVKPDKADPDFRKKTSWAFVTDLAYGTNKLTISLDSLPGDEKKLAAEALKNYQQAEIRPAGELYFSRSASGNGISLWVMKNRFLFADEIDPANILNIQNTLKRYARFQYLKNLRFNEPGLSADVDLIFLDKYGRPEPMKKKQRTILGQTEYREDDVVYLKIKNTGKKDFYINIVDIQPDGIINPVIPNKKLTDQHNNPNPVGASDCFIKAHDSLIFKKYAIRIAPPYGNETFKIFLSTSEIDLEDMLTKNMNTVQTKGVLKDLELFFNKVMQNEAGTRAVNNGISNSQNGTIFSMNFKITPK